MSFPVGLTDGNGTVAGLPEDEDDPFASIVSDAVTASFDIAPVEGFTEAAPGETVAPEPVYEPAPQGDNFFGEHGLEIAEQDAPWQPTIRMGGDLSSLNQSADFFLNQQIGAAPTPGGGLGAEFAPWFGTPEEQQARAEAWDAAVNAAIEHGDAAEYARLMREREVVDQAWKQYQAESATYGQMADDFYGDFYEGLNDPGFMGGEGPPDLMLRGIMDQIGTPQVDTPYGPMSLTDAQRRFEQDQRGSQGRMFDVDRADALQLFPQLDDARNAQMARDRFFTLPNQFGGEHGDPFAEGQQADYRDFAMTQPNLRWDTGGSVILDAIGAGLGAVVDAAQWAGATPVIGTRGFSVGFGVEVPEFQVTGTDALKAAWFGVNIGAETAWQAATYTSAAERYLAESAAEATGLDPRLVARVVQIQQGMTGNLAATHYRRGDGLLDTARQTYDTQPWYVRVAGETIYDPLNFVGAGTVLKAADAAQWGNRGIKATRIRHATQEGVDAGLISPDLVKAFTETKPSGDIVNRLRFATDDLTVRFQQAGIPDDLASDAFAKRLVMEWHLTGNTGGILDDTTKRVYDDMLRVVETKYGTAVAKQVARTQQVAEQVARLANNPSNIPLPNGSIAIVQGNRLQMVIPAGKRVEQLPLPTPSSRQSLPSGLTRRSGTGEIVTVSRKGADDALRAAVRAEEAVNDVRPVQAVIDAPAPSVAPETASRLPVPDDDLTGLMPPAPPRQIEGVPVAASMDQMRWLQFFSQRDGVNYWDELVAAGETTPEAITAKLQALDSTGLTTAEQFAEMNKLGIPATRKLELTHRPSAEAAAEIERAKRARITPSEPMTVEQFYAAARGNPTLAYKYSQVSRAARLSRQTGMDLLGDAIRRNMDAATFAAYTDADNLPMTHAQRQQVQRLIEQGSLKPIANLDSLSINDALRLFKQGKQKRGFLNATEAKLEHNVDAPLEVIGPVDVVADRAADAVVVAKKQAQHHIRRHIPRFTEPKSAAVGAAGFRTRVARATDQGVEVMSPVAFKQWMIDMGQAGTFKGTAYEGISDEIARAVIFVDKGGTFSSQTADAAFERLMRDLVDLSGRADLDDTRRFVDALDSAYNGDRYRAITEATGRKVKGVTDEMRAERVEMARGQLPVVEADLKAVTRDLNLHHTGVTKLDDRALREAQARKGQLEQQRDRLLEMTNPRGKDAPAPVTKRQQAAAKREQDVADLKNILPEMPDVPPIEAGPEVAAQASDVDLLVGLKRGQVPARDPQVVVEAQPQLLNVPTVNPKHQRALGEARTYLDELEPKRLDWLAGQMTHTYDPNVIEPSQMPRAISKTLRSRGVTPEALAEVLAERTGKQLPLRMRGGDIAAGGGLGIIDPAQRRLLGLKSNLAKPKVVSTIEPNLDAWRNANWDVVGPELDAYARRHYSFDGLLMDDERLKVFGKSFSPAELTKMSKVTRAGDSIHADLYRISDEARAAENPYEFIRERVRMLTTADWKTVQATSDYYTKSEVGRETLRLWREYGKAVLDEFDNLIPHENMVVLVNADIFPKTDDGIWQRWDIEKIDNIMRGKFGKMTPKQRQMAETFQKAYGASWEANVRPHIYDDTEGSFVKRASRADIEGALFQSRADDISDSEALALKIGSFVADRHAEKLGYDPDKIDPFLRTQMYVKGHLAPIWMTMMPTYHLNNLSGNIFAQIVQAARGGNGVSPFPVVPKAWKEASQRAGSGVGVHRFMSPGVARSQMTEIPGKTAAFNQQGRLRPALIGATIKGKRRTFVPGPAQVLDWNPFAGQGLFHSGGGSLTKMENLGEAIEGFSRESIYGQTWMHHHARLWRKELDNLLGENTVTPPELDELVMKIGIDEVQQALIGKPNLERVLAAKRSVMAQADYRAYQATADALRDYRMRNRVDAALDRVLPVHYWSTKNALFMTRAAMDRPALALSAAQAYNMLAEEQGETPFGLAKGYVKAPQAITDLLGLVPGSEYFLRVSQLTNPLIFAVPKFVAAMARDAGNMPEGSTLMERLETWGKDGLANFWEASGYRVGPQWDWAIKATNRLNQNPDGLDADIMTALNFINSPYTNYQGERVGGQQGAIPLGGLESVLRRFDIPGTGVSINDAVLWANQLALGSPYTNYEVSQARAWMQQDSSIDWSEAKQANLNDALLAMAEGNFDHPYVAEAMEHVLQNQSDAYLRGRVFGLAGREYTLNAQRIDAGWDLYEAMQVRGKELGKTDPTILWQLPAELRWMIRDSGADKPQIEAAVTAAREGKSHPLLERAAKAMHNEDWAHGDQQKYLATIAKGQADYERLVAEFGEDYADDYMFGTLNKQTGQREGGAFPALAVSTAGSADPEENLVELRANKARREAYAARDAYYNDRLEKSHKARPYFERLEKNDEMLRNHVAQAGDDMRTQDVAYRAHAALAERIYADAAAAGVDLGGSGEPPKEGRSHYTRTTEERRFLEWNGALEAVEGRERAQARQGFVLDLVAEQLGVKKWVGDELNPQFVDDKGQWDEEAYQAAREEAARQAPELFRQIVMDIREGGDFIELGVNGRGVTPDDFLYHTGEQVTELDQWRDRRWNERAAYFDMPDETPEQKAAKDAERVRLVTEYGPEVFDRHYGPTYGEVDGEIGPDVVFTAAENRRYGEQIKAAGSWYATLSPADKDAVKTRYPDAFEPATFVNEEGETVEYDKFVPSKLTGAQAAEIVAENGLADQSSTTGKDRATRIEEQRGTPEEQQRRMDANFVQVKSDEFDAILTDEDEFALQMFYSAKDDPRFAEAEALKDRSVTRKGFPSWKLARIAAEEAGDTELVGVIDQYLAAVDGAKPVWEKQDAWFQSQPDDVKELLIREYPSRFGRYAETGDDPPGTPVSPTGESGAPATSNATGSGSTSYTPRPSVGSTFTPYSSGGGGNRGAGGGSLPGRGDLPVLDQLIALDPFLSSGQDDGRSVVAQQVSDHIDRLTAAIGMMPDGARWAKMFRALFVQMIGRMLGPNPDMQQWQAALAFLTRQRGNQPPAAPEPPAPDNVSPPLTPPQPEPGLGAY